MDKCGCACLEFIDLSFPFACLFDLGYVNISQTKAHFITPKVECSKFQKTSSIFEFMRLLNRVVVWIMLKYCGPIFTFVWISEYVKILICYNTWNVVMVGYRAGEGGGLHLIQCLLFVWSGVKLIIIHYIEYTIFMWFFYKFYITIIVCSDMYRDASYNSFYTFSPPYLGNDYFLHF